MSPSKQTLDSVSRCIRRHRMLCAGDVVGVAVSGGADSLALALLLDELRDELGVRLVVLHLNHRLRGRESDEDAQFVCEFAASRGMEAIFAERDVSKYASSNRLNLEDAGRRLRYEFFDQQVALSRVTRVAVAHTADDQAETVLAKLIRGSGPSGLAAIYPVANNVVRPLIEIRRADLREYLLARNQPWREDSTNGDERRLRARIRSRLLPLMESEFQPAIVSNLSNLAGLAREDEEYWQQVIEDRFLDCVDRRDNELEISAAALSPAPSRIAHAAGGASTAVSSRLVRRIASELAGSHHGMTYEHIQTILALSSSETGGRQLELPSRIVVEYREGLLIFRRRARADVPAADRLAGAPAEFHVTFDLKASSTASVELPQFQRRLCLKTIDWPLSESETSHYAIDWELLKPPLVLRNWRPGDAYRPQGFLRSRKIRRLLQEKHISRSERAVWPVLESGGAIAWARSFPVAREFAASAKTRVGVLISEESL